jgi:type II restriction enzyme
LNLTCSLEPGFGYRSNAQIARVVTENWCAKQMYCPACSSNALTASPNNCPGVDFTCPKCTLAYQLKSRKPILTNRVVDAGYDAMIRAIRSERVPNLFLLRYSSAWSVTDLLLVPSFFLTESAVERRKPLSATARRAGWVGCNILLDNIPIDGRIAVVSKGIAISPAEVRREYQRIKPLGTLKADLRGWTLDVLNVLRKTGEREIVLSDVYAFEQFLQNLHPNNKNIRPKIRQQLQVLRDLGFLSFEGNGRYRLLR